MKKLVSILCLLCLVGCSTIAGLEKGEGDMFVIKGKSYDIVWDTTLKVASKNLTIRKKDKGKGVMKGTGGLSLTSWGEVVGIFIDRHLEDKGKIIIEIVSNKASKLQLTRNTDWGRILRSQIETAIESL